MSYVLAVDVGTSFTAAAVARFDHGITPVPECLPLGLRGAAVPSVVYYPEEGPILVGEAAERRGLDSPGRVVREFKRRIGDAVPISVGTLSLTPEDVFATVARWVADRAAEREGAPPSDIVLTHPAAWGSHRTSLIRDALAAKGLANVTLLTEPEAAALHYASQVRVEDGSTIAVYDLGGGTFDTAVLRKAGTNRFELVGRPEGIEDLGGADFDAAVFQYVVDNTGGALAGLDPAAPGVLAALARLRRECVEAKEALSSDSEASISVLLPGIQQQVRLVRSEFEALIEEPVRDTVDALEQSLEQLELEPADLSAVLLIGGSSRIPLVAQVISGQLERPIAVDADPKSSICLGAAVSAILAQPEAAPEGTLAGGAAAGGLADASSGSAAAEDGHMPARLPSWSRRNPTVAGAVSGAAHGPGHGHHGGAHAPKPTVRLTAIAAAAALLTVLTATAAQSPEGFGSLTAVFVPGAEAAAPGGGGTGSGDPPGGNGTGTGGAATAATGDSSVPLAGIEAAVVQAAPAPDSAAPQEAGLEVEASPTSRQSSSTPGEMSAAGETVTGSAAAGPGTSTGTAPGTVAATGDTTAGGTTGPAGTPSSTETPSETPSTPDTTSSTETPSETPSTPDTTSSSGTPSSTETPSPSETPPSPGTPSPSDALSSPDPPSTSDTPTSSEPALPSETPSSPDLLTESVPSETVSATTSEPAA